MAKDLVPATKVKEVAKADRLMDEVERLTTHTNKMLAACDEYLTDSEDPTKYDIGPRSTEIDVQYLTKDSSGRTVKRKERLSALLERLDGNGKEITATFYKIADPRELLLKTVDRMKDLAELLARVTGELREAQTNIQINQLGVVFLPPQLTPEQWMEKYEGNARQGNTESMESAAETEDSS